VPQRTGHLLLQPESKTTTHVRLAVYDGNHPNLACPQVWDIKLHMPTGRPSGPHQVHVIRVPAVGCTSTAGVTRSKLRLVLVESAGETYFLRGTLEPHTRWRRGFLNLDGKRLRNGWVISSHQPPTMIHRWWRGVGTRVVLKPTIAV
jgi:hypothetical protein